VAIGAAVGVVMEVAQFGEYSQIGNSEESDGNSDAIPTTIEE
jgi:hypothetical protein